MEFAVLYLEKGHQQLAAGAPIVVYAAMAGTGPYVAWHFDMARSMTTLAPRVVTPSCSATASCERPVFRRAWYKLFPKVMTRSSFVLFEYI